MNVMIILAVVFDIFSWRGVMIARYLQQNKRCSFSNWNSIPVFLFIHFSITPFFFMSSLLTILRTLFERFFFYYLPCSFSWVSSLFSYGGYYSGRATASYSCEGLVPAAISKSNRQFIAGILIYSGCRSNHINAFPYKCPWAGFKIRSEQDGCLWRLQSYRFNHLATTAGFDGKHI